LHNRADRFPHAAASNFGEVIIMAYKVDKRDMQFIIKEMLDLDKLLSFERFKDYSIEDFDMVIDQGIKFAIDKVAPLNKNADKIGAQYDPETKQVTVPEDQISVYQEYCANGWLAPTADVEHGGGGFPGTVGICTGEAFTGACMPFTMTPGLTSSAAHVIQNYGTDEQKAMYLEKMFAGQWAGTMCLTEPGAGSAVGDLKTSAKPQDDHYIISGTKIFISSGDHNFTENIVHLVLARIEGEPAGMKGVSLFIVPKYLVNEDGTLGELNDMYCGGIEEKMGIHGSPTCTLNFGDEGKCKGWLLGEKNRGIVAMFQMMNEARIGVGVQSLSQAAGALGEATDYARDRIQGVDILNMKDPEAPRIPIIEHPDVRRMLMTMKAYTEGCRGLLYKTANYGDVAMYADDEKERETAKGFLDLLTPICKAYISDVAFKVCELGVQVLGGYGYCAEYPLEQYLRDEKICSIYEGTNGIQALDLLGRKLGMKGGMVLMSYMMEINNNINKLKGDEELGKAIEVLEKARDVMAGLSAKLPKLGKEDPYYPILYATPFLELFGEIAVANILVEQAAVAKEKLAAILEEKGATDEDKKKEVLADSSEAAFYFNKIKTCQFFCTNILPGVFAKEYAFNTGDKSPLDVIL